ncbi:MAG: SH3 domain-containing protein [Leptospiraceae bacterium]|nr:SH3 domain-containing protein [Leptospiraceae bacterium]
MQSIYLFIIILYFSIGCKLFNKTIITGEKVNLVAFVIGSNINVYKEPNYSSETVTTFVNNTQFQIIEKQIKDNDRKNLFWYKVTKDSITGYVSEDEEKRIDKPNLTTIEDFSIEEDFLVNADSLRLREIPSLTGKVLTNLVRNTKVKVIGRSKIYETIDNRHDYWVKVKTENSTIGFCFHGFLYPNSLIEGYDTKRVNDFFEYKEGMIFYKSIDDPTPQPITKLFGNMIINLQTGDILPIEYIHKKGSSIFYEVNTEVTSSNINSFETSHISGFFKASDLRRITSILEFTFEKYGFKDKDFYEFLKRNPKNKNLDLRKVKLTPIKHNSMELFHVLISYDSYVSSSDTSEAIIYIKKEGEYLEIFKQEGRYSDDVELHDFDNDGISELILKDHGRMSSTYRLYKISSNRLVEILKLKIGEPFTEADSVFASYKLEGDFLKLKFNLDGSTSDKDKTYKYVKGNFVLNK